MYSESVGPCNIFIHPLSPVALGVPVGLCQSEHGSIRLSHLRCSPPVALLLGHSSTISPFVVLD